MASKRPLPSSSSGEGSASHDPSHSKKTKVDDIADDDYSPPDDITMSLIDEMDALEEEEELMRAADQPHPPANVPMPTPTPPPPAANNKPHLLSTPTGTVASSMQHQAPTRKEGSAKWRRPPPPPIDPSKDVVTFQQIDIDHYMGSPIPGMPGLQTNSVPILRMYGVTMEGNSVCAHLHGFLPYFYVPLPCEQFGPEHCKEFMSALSDAVAGDRAGKGMSAPVLAVEICQRCSLYGFHFNKKFPFLKITVAAPKLVAATKRLVCSLQMPPFRTVCSQTYESNIEYEIRYMVDSGVVGCNWIECPAGAYKLRRPSPATSATTSTTMNPQSGFTVIGSVSGLQAISKCQIELDIHWEEIVSHPAEGEWQKIAPVRILSFDIECAARKGVFPEDVTTFHLSECKCRPVECPNSCGATNLQHQHLEEHVSSQCPLTLVECEFSNEGCDAKVHRRDLPSHLRTNMVTHMSLLARENRKLKNEVQSLNKKHQKENLELRRLIAVERMFLHVPPLKIKFRLALSKSMNVEFYSHAGAEKLQLSVELAEYDISELTGQLIVSCKILNNNFMRKCRVTISIIDQEKDKDHIVKKVENLVLFVNFDPKHHQDWNFIFHISDVAVF